MLLLLHGFGNGPRHLYLPGTMLIAGVKRRNGSFGPENLIDLFTQHHRCISATPV
jgi:hypothetical protein